ncbi:MAG TPA: hypothetical protein VD793_04200, partial [Gemmatimonadales bacterium]|nr:hypothetical protein [Gemmatimonadales bacterium]
ADRYRIERELGQGGMATVYLAQGDSQARDRWIPCMSSPRRNMTARVVPLRSREASNAAVDGTVSERLGLVAALSKASWKLTARPLPVYTRATMPVVVTNLRAQAERT